ncbi:arsenite methyltransferase [Halosolutus gelatinilyticus]|uniref:arsenite methyltransferase n=1 Tax=Halosolutus gelatinilyticus TaxID=2931975 RepID=UPI001FF44874|nr:arsenite methyltransferase [Halosolutus gelatinilyticus]
MTDETLTDDAPADGETTPTDPATRRSTVREEYGSIASTNGDCCGGENASATDDGPAAERACSVGYDAADLEGAPDDANLGLGCGNPIAISNLEPGETVLDLGSGGGFDCFLAAREVGPDGTVIGVDMTPEMIDTARTNARESDLENVEFRLGEIEHLPVADGTVDAIISNCVVNLSPEKPRVLAEAYRVLRPGGTIAISDLVATEPLSEELREDPEAVTACVGGAATIDELERWLAEAGFVDVSIAVEGEWVPSDETPVVSARIEGRKPA